MDCSAKSSLVGVEPINDFSIRVGLLLVQMSIWDKMKVSWVISTLASHTVCISGSVDGNVLRHLCNSSV